MFVTQKMILLDILLLQKDVEDVSKLIIESNFFELSAYSSLASDTENKWSHENTTGKKKLIYDLQKSNQELELFFHPYRTGSLLITNETPAYTIPFMSDTIRQYKTKKDQLEERYYLIKKNKEKVAIKIAGLRMYMDTQRNNKKVIVNESATMYSILGLINISNLSILKQEFSRFNGELLTEGHVNDSEIVFITIPENQKEELTTLLEQLYFINYGLPEEFFGEGIANMMKLGLEYTIICDQEEMLEFEIKKITPIIIDTLDNISDSLKLYAKILEVSHSMKQAGHFVLLSGWITASKYRELQKKLKTLCGDIFEITVTGTETFRIEVDIPTKLQNPKIFKPFEQLVTTFGIPNYKEIDPTIIFAGLYVFMYGAMFGDVGQGALLLLCGIFGKLFKKQSNFNMIFGIMIWVGMSSTIFGVLYGSYFGYESTLYAWVPEPLWLSPMHNINTILLYAIFFGIGVISFSYVLGIINAIRMREWDVLIFSHKGLIAFIIYIIVLSMGYMMIKGVTVPISLFYIFGILSLFLGLERIWEALFYGHGSIKDWWMGFFDMFEFFLSMLTNTLSFVRIGAFALTHTALMMAIFTLRDLAGGDTFMAYMIVIIGNIFVIGMEGFIVGIQTLRLEYYEFFMRFFRGTGRLFKPIVHKS